MTVFLKTCMELILIYLGSCTAWLIEKAGSVSWRWSLMTVRNGQFTLKHSGAYSCVCACTRAGWGHLPRGPSQVCGWSVPTIEGGRWRGVLSYLFSSLLSETSSHLFRSKAKKQMSVSFLV